MEQRMYGLVMYNISPIQQGIQFGHAVQEYNNDMIDGGMTGDEVAAFNRWRKEDKTFIIYSGGSSNSDEESVHYGQLNQHLEQLKEFGIKHATFNEPDLNDALSAVVFLVNEKIFDAKKYPDFHKWMVARIGQDAVYAKTYGNRVPLSQHCPVEYSIWEDEIGEEVIEFRTWLKQFRFA